MKVLVIAGGISDEREVSLRSASAVYEAIGPAHQKFLYDWDGSAEWILDHAAEYDAALPILHGVGGEDGQIQAILENARLLYLGSGVETSKICIDKEKTQRMLRENGILVPKQSVVTRENYETDELSQIPHVLKPVSGGSSIDTYVLKNGRLDKEKQNEVFEKHPSMILEECIDGPELTVPVLDGYDLPAIEIIPGNEFFDFETKYDGSSKEICNSENIPADIQANARSIAKKCHEILSCRHLSRVDIMLNSAGVPYVIEVNTMPGLTDQSLFPKAAAYIGLTMPQLVEYFVQLAAKSPVITEV